VLHLDYESDQAYFAGPADATHAMAAMLLRHAIAACYCGMLLRHAIAACYCGPNRAEPRSPLGPANPARQDLTRLGSLVSRTYFTRPSSCTEHSVFIKGPSGFPSGSLLIQTIVTVQDQQDW
jgi:hypothetical protein